MKIPQLEARVQLANGEEAKTLEEIVDKDPLDGEEAKTLEEIVDKDPLDGESLGAISVGPGGPCPKGLADGGSTELEHYLG